MPTHRSILLGLSVALSLLPLPACKKEPPPKPPVTDDGARPPFAQTVDGVFSAFRSRPCSQAFSEKGKAICRRGNIFIPR